MDRACLHRRHIGCIWAGRITGRREAGVVGGQLVLPAGGCSDDCQWRTTGSPQDRSDLASPGITGFHPGLVVVGGGLRFLAVGPSIDDLPDHRPGADSVRATT